MQMHMFCVSKMCIVRGHKIIELKAISELTSNQIRMCGQALVKTVFKELLSFSGAHFSYS